MDTSASGRPAPAPSPDDIRALTELVGGYRISQAIHVVATLGIADLLSSGPRGVDAIAQETGSHEPSLFRLLRFLSGVGLFEEVTPRQFALTSRGAGLRTDIPRTVQPTAAYVGRDVFWQAWGNLGHTVMTGETAFSHTHGSGLFELLAIRPDVAATFNRAMTSNTANSGNAIAEVYDFSSIETIVDIGGGHGQLIATILAAHPLMRGILFDRPEVVSGAGPTLQTAGVADRCQVIGGDFFDSVPMGADAYVLRQIIHDWDDADALRILELCRAAIRPSSRVLIVERVISNDYHHSMPELQLDMQMMVIAGGIQRTEDEYRSLYQRSGFEMRSIVPLHDAAHYAIYEGVPI